MPILNVKDMLLKATDEKYAVGSFNVTNFLQMKAVVQTAIDKKSPLITQTSVKPSRFCQPISSYPASATMTLSSAY